MSLNDPRFINFDGSSVTGRVPPALRVAEGRELTPTQAGAVAHAYKLFKDAANVSVAEFLVQNRTLSDGTRVRLVSIQGQDTVTVWPTGGEKKSFVLRGFVIAPIAVSGSALSPEKIDEAILTAVDKWAKWVPLRYRYRPGEKREALAYMVTKVPFVGKEVKGILAKFTTWAGKLIRGILPVSDAEYNDVYVIKDDAIYKNAVAVKRMGAVLENAFPAVFPSADLAVIFASDQRVARTVPATPIAPAYLETVYDWNGTSNFITPGVQEYRGGVEIREEWAEGVPEYHANYIAYNQTSPGAVQTWVGTAKLLPIAPFADIALHELNQLGVQSLLNSNDGWELVTSAGAAAPIFGVQDPTSLVMAYTYALSGDMAFHTGSISSGPLQLEIGGGRNLYTFKKTHTAPESVKLNNTEFMTITRQVVIDSTTDQNSSSYYGTWPGPGRLGYASDAYSTMLVAYALLDPGDKWLLVVAEGVTRLIHRDTTTSKVEVPLLPHALWDVSVDHHIDGVNGYSVERPAKSVADGGAVGAGPTAGFAARIGPGSVGVYTSDLRNEQGYSLASYEDTHTFTAKAKDYIFSDRTNGVFVWIEAEIVSNRTGASSGSSSTVIRSCIRFDGADHKAVLFSATYGAPRWIQQVAPWGINFGTSPLGWTYHQPKRPMPIYAPTWSAQGLCPFIAYTLPEEGAPAAPRIAAFFRLQLVRRFRGIEEPEPPTLQNVTTFYPYMVQQLLENYGHVGGTSVVTLLRDTFNLLEAQPTIIKLALPDADLFANVGAPTDDAAHYAKFYRT